MKLKVTLCRSPIGRPKTQRTVLAGLGLRRLHSSRVLEDTPSVRGMVNKISHLVEWESVDDE